MRLQFVLRGRARACCCSSGDRFHATRCAESSSPQSHLVCWPTCYGPAQILVDGAIRIDRARLFLDGQIVQSAIRPAAASIARFDLDLALWRAATASGVEARDQVTVTRVEGGDTSLVISSTGSLRARAVVDATGRWSNLSPRQSSPGPKWLGIKGHFREAHPSKTVDLYFFDGGYCGVQPVDLLDGSTRGIGSTPVRWCARTVPPTFLRFSNCTPS